MKDDIKRLLVGLFIALIVLAGILLVHFFTWILWEHVHPWFGFEFHINFWQYILIFVTWYFILSMASTPVYYIHEYWYKRKVKIAKGEK
jgi:hypothetical protein